MSGNPPIFVSNCRIGDPLKLFNHSIIDTIRLNEAPDHTTDNLLPIAEGDTEAFARLFKGYYERLHRFMWRHTGSATDADEIIQETFVRVWLHRDELPAIHDLRAWIFKIAAREYLNWVRRNRQAAKPAAAIKNQETPIVTTPLEETHLRELNQLVQKAVDALPDQRQRIYRMSREQGMKIAEIAVTLNIAESTVKNTLTTVLRNIRDYLATHGHPLVAVIWYCVTKH